jgi:hypothetical protein
MIAAGVATELVVIHDSATDMAWISPVLIAGGVVGSLALLLGHHGVGRVGGRRLRTTVLAAIAALLLTAPGAWAVQTLGHATSSTFPAGGPASSGMGMGGPGGMRGGGQGGPGGMRGPGGPGGTTNQGAPPAMPGASGGTTSGPGTASGATGSGATGGSASGSASSVPSGTSQTSGATGTSGGRSGGLRGGGMFGGNSAELTAAVTYAASQGGGTIGVSSQSTAAASILSGSSSSSVTVAGIGGFSGSESAVTAEWLAEQVESGNIRWVLTSSGGMGGGASGGRVGSTQIMALVEKVGTSVPSVDGLYDLQGLASAIRAAG